MKVSRLAGPERLADCGSSSVITFWTLPKFQNISRSVVGRDSAIGSCPYARSKRICRSRMFQRNHLLDFKFFFEKVWDRKTRRSRYFSTGRSRTTRRLRIFQRNHLLTLSKFQNISKSAEGRDAPMKVSRLAGPERLADCGSSSVITFWTFSKF